MSTSNLLDRITFNPRQCGGRPCIRGLRVRVSDVLDMLAGGAARTDILRDFPYLEDADISAASLIDALNAGEKLIELR